MTLHATIEAWTGSVDALLAWVRGGAAPVEVEGRWLLAHCDDGVVWGMKGADGRWLLSGDVFPDVSPNLELTTVQQLRVFGDAGELLVWRHEGRLNARWLADSIADAPSWMLPYQETRLLLGDHVEKTSQGFALLRDAAGVRHAAPVSCGAGRIPAGRRPKLRVRHYFERDSKSGAVRVAASRLVAVEE